jgi:hypothetical protein
MKTAATIVRFQPEKARFEQAFVASLDAKGSKKMIQRRRA